MYVSAIDFQKETVLIIHLMLNPTDKQQAEGFMSSPHTPLRTTGRLPTFHVPEGPKYPLLEKKRSLIENLSQVIKQRLWPLESCWLHV